MPSRPPLPIPAGALILTIGLATACGGGRAVQPWEFSPRPMADTLAIWEPAERNVPIIYESAHAYLIDPVFGSFRADDAPALNVDAMDEVVNSTWFVNRNADRALTPDEVFRGPRTTDGPDTSGPITIWDNKSEGVNVGFFIEDAGGDRWLVKLDPPEWSEMSSGADVVATNLVWAAGYHTPENHVYYLDPGQLRLDEGVELTLVEDGQPVTYRAGSATGELELTIAKLRDGLLAPYPRQPDGTIRASASKFLPGIPKGPFGWQGMRADDPNDVIPHEHRREVRGYYVVASWINQVDTKQDNTLDVFVLAEGSPTGKDERRYGHLVHYMLDNGSSLGSGGAQPHDERVGSEYELDLGAAAKRFLSLGLYERPWQSARPANPPGIGWFEAEPFDPGDWRSRIPNRAFELVGPRDGYWGAKLVMSFTDEQIDRVLDAAEWSDPAVREYVRRGLLGRRDKIGRYWFAQVSPLDEPRVEGGAVAFDDLWARHFGGPTRYRWAMRGAPEPGGIVDAPRVPLPAPAARLAHSSEPAERYERLEIWKVWPDGREAPRPATIWLEPAGGGWRLVGVRY